MWCVLVTKDNIEPSRRDGGKWMLGNEEIPEVNTYKYLGVDKQKRRTWKNHVERIIEKAKKRIGVLRLIGAH